MFVTDPLPPAKEVMVITPVAPLRVIFAPAIRLVTPVLVTTTLPVVGDTLIPVPPVTRLTAPPLPPEEESVEVVKFIFSPVPTTKGPRRELRAFVSGK
jgi:hypothetical protein